MRKELSQKALGRALGISQPMVSRLAARGMPTHDVVAAQHWRERNLNPAATKATRDKLKSARVQIVPSTKPAPFVSGAEHAKAAAALAEHLGAMLEAGQSVAPLLPAMRQALRAVPFDYRDFVPMSAALWRELLAAHLEELTQPDPPDTPPMSDIEKEVTGWICYRLAAGEGMPE